MSSNALLCTPLGSGEALGAVRAAVLLVRAASGALVPAAPEAAWHLGGVAAGGPGRAQGDPGRARADLLDVPLEGAEEAGGRGRGGQEEENEDGLHPEKRLRLSLDF